MSARPSLLSSALAAHAAGLQPIPVKEDGSKRPDLDSWTEYQTRPVTDHELQDWFANGRRGVGIVCGAISGNLEMFEFEGRAIAEGISAAFIEAADAAGLGPLVDRIQAGYCERTPGGGIHWLYRCPEIERNRKLARRPATAEELLADPDDTVKVLIETRGEGGQVVVAPSSGPVHATGRAWEIVAGSFDTIATITPQERSALLDLARSFDVMPVPEWTVPEPRPRTVTDGELRPGDEFNARASWSEILTPHGWAHVYRRGDVDYWRRPGKTHGISATTNHADSGLLYVFSSSTVFEPERGYSPFAAWTILNHGGDFETAARALAADGYGAAARQRADDDAFLDELTGAGATAAKDDVEHEDQDDEALRRRWPDVDDFLAVEDEPYRWKIPGIAEAGDRFIVTGTEGTGKSTWLRQLAIQAASGIHPFTGDEMDPVPVLLIDCENSERQVRRKLRPLRDAAGDRYQHGMLRVRVVGQAVNLARPAVEQDLATVVDHFQPGLIILGPLYKLAEGDPKDEQAARLLAGALDRLRAISGAALIIEAHTPYADGSKARRPIRPYGASLWSRWPEFGIYLAPDGKLEPWRGHRDERSWPDALERSTPWPWAAVAAIEAPEDEDGWHGPTRCIEAIVHLLTDTGEELSKRQLADRLRALGQSYRDTTIGTAAEQAATDGILTARTGPRNARLFKVRDDVQELLA